MLSNKNQMKKKEICFKQIYFAPLSQLSARKSPLDFSSFLKIEGSKTANTVSFLPVIRFEFAGKQRKLQATGILGGNPSEIEKTD